MTSRNWFATAVLVTCLAASPVAAQEGAGDDGNFDVDFLLSYYDQDGDHSAVTGGIGTEKLEVVSPVVFIVWRVDEDYTLSANIGVDQISSASIGNIGAGTGGTQALTKDDNVSGASIPAGDTRTFGLFKASRVMGRHNLGVKVGLSNEYDYRSVSAGIDWLVRLNRDNTSVSLSLDHFADTIDLIDITGENRGNDNRSTTALSVILTQVLGRSTLMAVEFSYISQSGFLSTPFHQVILAEGGQRVAERLPDTRGRAALGLRLNHAFSDRVVGKIHYRFYSDDWGIVSNSVTLETHFRLPGDHESWLYPIIRFHSQEGCDYFGEAETFIGDERYMTSDWDLAGTTSNKVGLGWSVKALPGQRWWAGIRHFDIRATVYSRDDGLRGISLATGTGWTF